MRTRIRPRGMQMRAHGVFEMRAGLWLTFVRDRLPLDLREAGTHAPRLMFLKRFGSSTVAVTAPGFFIGTSPAPSAEIAGSAENILRVPVSV